MRIIICGNELATATAAAALAWVGHQVTWHLLNGKSWQQLSTSKWLASEPQLMERLEEAIHSGRLQFMGSATDVPQDILWLALSPEQRDQAVEIVLSSATQLSEAAVLVNNSTFPVGETEQLESLMAQSGRAVSLPDLIEEGRAWDSFTRPARWLLGCDNDNAEATVREVLRAFNRRSDIFHRMPRRAAELTKLAINGMLATRISYMNEIAGLADSLDVDVEYVRQGMGSDSRIGYEYLYPGCGFGGPSFSRDLMRLADAQNTTGRHSALLDRVLDINEQKKEALFRRLWHHYQGKLEGCVVAIWGAAFKPGTARIDHAPVLPLLDALWAQGAQVQLHDPAAVPALQDKFGDHPQLTLYASDPMDALQGADVLMLVTEWKAYWNPDWQTLASALKGKLLLDGRNIYDPGHVASVGLHYRGIGRRADPPSGE
ncbi:nucleotide sugar dehydrogenase [Halomonas halocynthiae]|uniref:nucleotide sugar dehydrogenase n=1 Tax=Halomonas halocynthiae TaxID=176290 RepID=UPI00040E8786|nr:nucleotide sugar dehydrogenase [Halomonas halocynthiae]